MAKSRARWIFIILILVAIFLISSLFAACAALFSTDFEKSGNVALISINGVITSTGTGAFFGDLGTDADTAVSLIEEANQNPGIKAIVFEINSPGGSAVASEEIANAISAVNKTTVSYIREAGASGGYWIASATVHIFASRMSLSGSIGVIASYLEFSGLLQDYNVSYERLVAGKYKDLGIPLKPLTPEERSIFQNDLDIIHAIFIEEVAKNRKLSEDKVKKLATGQVFLGQQGLELGLIDEIGGKKEALAYVEKTLGIKAEIVEYEKETTFLDILKQVMNENSFYIGKGVASYLTNDAALVSQPSIRT